MDIKKNGKIKSKKTVINIAIIACFLLTVLFIYLTLKGYLDQVESKVDAENIKDIYYSSTPSISDEELPLFTPIASVEPSAVPSGTVSEITSNPSDTQKPKTPSVSEAVTPAPITESASPSKNPADISFPSNLPSQSPQTNSEDKLVFNEKFFELLTINEDVVGWIKINGTNIDYPILLGDDNVYYLTRNIYEEETRAASIFMDYRNSVGKLSKNTILYGHNLDDSTMFSELNNYVDDKVRNQFIKDYGVVEFNSIYKDMKFEIFSAYVENVNGFQYIKTSFKSDEEFLDYIDKVKNMSLISTNVNVSADDHIITLSTCNHWFLDSRTVIHARLITD